MLLGLGPHMVRGLVIAAIGVFFAIVGIHPALRNMAALFPCTTREIPKKALI